MQINDLSIDPDIIELFNYTLNDDAKGVLRSMLLKPLPSMEAAVERQLYNENYETLPMRHSWAEADDTRTVEYGWRKKGQWHTIKTVADKTPVDIKEGSEEEFITEHFWGYTKINNSMTSEYEVVHPRWQIYPVQEYEVNIDFEKVYGSEFGFLQELKPVSVYLAEGSGILVKQGRKLKIKK